MINRKQNEDDFSYKVRLCVSKINKEIDLDWSEIATLLGIDWSADHLRKLGSAYKEYYDYLEQKPTDDENYDSSAIEELNVKIRELQKERVKVQTEKLELRELVRDSARNEMFLEQIQDALVTLKPLQIPTKLISKNNKYAIGGWADCHYGKEIEIKGFDGEYINLYNPQVFEDRMASLLAKYINVVHKEEIDTIVLLGLGDDIDGLLRVSTLMTLKYGMVDSTIKFAHYISNWVNELSKHVKIRLGTTRGNHSEARVLNAKSGDFPNENMEIIIYEFMKLILKDNPNVEFLGCSKLLNIQVGNINILATHGQNERNLEQSIKDYSMIYNIRPNLLLTGHLHSSSTGTVGKNEFGNIDYIQFPSIVGVDEYSISIKKSACAGGKLIIIDGKDKINYDFVLE